MTYKYKTEELKSAVMQNPETKSARKTKAQLIEELEETKAKVEDLKHQLDIEKQKDSFREACDLLKYMMDTLQSAGLTHEEAFQFVITGFKGGMRL